MYIQIIMKKFLTFFSQNIRMSTSIINFNDKKLKRSDFYNKNKKIFNTSDTDINKILVSKGEQYGKHSLSKYFIGYNNNDIIRPLCLFMSQTTGCINKFDKNKIAMPLMINDILILKNYNRIWKKIEKLMKINFNTKTTYGDDDEYIKTRIKTYKDSITTNFYNKNGSKKIPEEKVPHKCLSIIILDSVIYAYEKYHPQTFLEECKYVKEKIKTNNFIDEELKSEFDSDSDSNNDIDIDNEE